MIYKTLLLVLIVCCVHNAVNGLNNKSQELLEKFEAELIPVLDYYEQPLITVPNLQTIYAGLREVQDASCRRDLTALFDGILRKERWAMTMFDATVKFPDGVRQGNSYFLGNFYECLGAAALRPGVKGQYCLADIYLANGTFAQSKKKSRNVFDGQLHWAFCVPSSCEHGDIAKVIEELFENALPAESSIEVTLDEFSCTVQKNIPLTNFELIFGLFLMVYLTLVIISTVYHALHIYKKKHCSEYSLDRSRKDYSKKHQLVISFSLIRSTAKVLEIRNRSNDFNLDCISGIKTLAMFFILSGHVLVFMISSPHINTAFYEDQMTQLASGIFLNSIVLVDSFLLMSGFLMSRLLLVELDKRKGRINYFALCLGRYIRLTPAYVVVICIYGSFLYRMESGPLWDRRVSLERDRCLDNWWTNLLYINNYVNSDKMCMFQSWYLSVDTQLFLLAPLIIYPLWRRRRYGEIILGVSFIATAVIPFIITYVYKLDPTLMIFSPEVSDLIANSYFNQAYVKTHMRANGYIIGIFLGYIIHRIQLVGYKFRLKYLIFGWVACSIVGLVSLYSIMVFYHPDYEYSVLDATIYAGFHRVGWSLALSWIILVSVTGDSTSLINRILSWKVWMPLSRLTYCSYLCSGVVEIYSYSSIKVPKYLSTYALSVETFGHLSIVVMAAFLLVIFFESPIHSIEKILLKSGTNKKTDSESTENFNKA